MTRLGFILCFSLLSFSLFSQSWTQVNSRSISKLGDRNINPDKFITAQVDDDEIRAILWSAPQELDFEPSRDKHTTIEIMTADGSMEQFSIVQYQMMEPNLASRYDQIRTFHGLSTTDPSTRIRISYTVYGLRAVITDQNGQTYIDHFQRNDKTHKIIYHRSDFAGNEDWTCDFQGEKHEDHHNHKHSSEDSRSGDCLFRSYRFSMTATGEYSNYHGATSSAQSGLVLSAMVVTVDRVNDVFEQDLTMRLILIDNVDDVFYYDPATDPFTGNDAGEMIDENQTNTNAVIGSANYDLGHIVSTGGSGLAGLGVICNNNNKARGVTGIGTPEGDPFDIDYVAHEIGHQLGANHTQNNSCNRNGSTAMEPGSASTIMGYAGICSPNVQNNSDAYFHAISVQEMNNELTSNSCHSTITLTNSAPVVDALTDKSIPHSTPFVLDVTATDGDGDVLTYNWEQMDNEVGPTMPPAGTNAQGPMFRSIFATTDSKRYFPNLTNLTNNTDFDWEVLPTVDRNMDFRVTVRDNNFAPGCTDEQDITLDVEGSAGPFLVTSQNTATTWLETESVNITWDVANTDAAPVSCSTVDILLSYDGGFTYTSTMIASTPNDGSETVSVPLGTTTQGRIMVKCSDNVFFDINDTDITINSGAPSFSIISNPSSASVCDDQSTSFVIESSSLLGYTDPITLSISNLPVGATSSISANPIIPGSNSTITIDNLDGLSGTSSILVTGVSGSITKEATFNLTIESANDSPTLSSPADGSTGTVTNPILVWTNDASALTYDYQVSTLPNGGNIVSSGNTSNSSVTVSPDLALATLFYWRVRTNTNCGTTAWSDDWTFETGTCLIKSADDLPISISASGTPTITSTFNIKDKGIVTDLNVVGLSGTHTYISDLNFTLIAPDATSQAFWSDPCGGQNDFNINLDDEAASSNHPCPPTDGLTYQPDSPLSVFDTKQMQGDWTLSVFDDFDADGGSLESWGIEVCLDSYCDLTVNNPASDGSLGTLSSAVACAVDGDTIFLESVLANGVIDLGSNTLTIDESIVIVANSNDNIKVASEDDAPTFIINAGKSVSLIGFSIENSDSSIGVMQNYGTLTIRDMNFTSGNKINSVMNESGATLNVEGDCRLFVD